VTFDGKPLDGVFVMHSRMATLMAASFRSPNTWRRLFLAKYAHRIGV
jgi:hypothetical protein